MLSVIVPIYNVAEYLEEALESLRKQTLQDVEFFLIVDGATDNSEEICRIFIEQDPRFQLIVKGNEGYGKTCNLGLALANGDYIAIFEPDDIIAPGMYDVLYNLAILHQVDIVRSNFLFLKENNFSSSPSFMPAIVNQTNPSDYHRGIKPIDKHIFYGKSTPTQLCFDPYYLFSGHASIWANIYKKQFIVENKIAFLETPGASFQDYPFHIQTFTLAQHILFVNDSFYYYRIHGANSSSTGKKLFVHLDIMDFLLQDKQLFQFVPPYARSRYFKAFLSQYIWWLNKNRSIGFTWTYAKKMAQWMKKNNWVIDATYSVPEQRLVKSCKIESHITQFFYTVYTMFYQLGPDHKNLRKHGLRFMRGAEVILVAIGIVKKIKVTLLSSKS